MMLRSVTVLVTYRMDSGTNPPTWKALRARVRDDSGVFGADLINPPRSMSPNDAVHLVLARLNKLAETVVITFDSKIGLPKRVYKFGRFVEPNEGQ